MGINYPPGQAPPGTPQYLAENPTWKGLMEYIADTTDNEDYMMVSTAVGFASLVTYLVFYTDTPEALASSLGDMPGSLLEAIPLTGR